MVPNCLSVSSVAHGGFSGVSHFSDSVSVNVGWKGAEGRWGYK